MMESKKIVCPACHGTLEVTNPKNESVLMIKCPNPACGVNLRVRFDTGETIMASKKEAATVPGYLTWDDIEVSWYAHTGGTKAMIYQEDPYINFTVEEYASEQNDLLVATTTGTRTSTDGNLNFTFDHACTALRFYVKKATNLNDYTLTLTSIKLCNVVSEGEYHFTNDPWTLRNSRSDYTLYGSSMSLGSESYTLLNANEGYEGWNSNFPL